MAAGVLGESSSFLCAWEGWTAGAAALMGEGLHPIQQPWEMGWLLFVGKAERRFLFLAC